MKEVHEFEKDEQPHFDIRYVNIGTNEKTVWGGSEMFFPDSTLSELANNTFDYLMDSYEMWIKDPQLYDDKPTLSEKFIPYIMALTVDNMVEEEMPLSFKIVNDCFVISGDKDATFKQTKQFFEKFYHLIFGFNYADSDANLIPEDEIESEQYIDQKIVEFDKKMKNMLGDKYISGNTTALIER